MIWGAASVGVVKIVHPLIEDVVFKIPKPFGNILFYGIIIYFIADFSFTILSLIQLKNIFISIQVEIDNAISKHSGIFNNQKEKVLESAKAKALESAKVFASARDKALENAKVIENIIEKFKLTLNHIRLIKAFPNVSSKSFDSIIRTLKRKLKKD